VVCGVGEVEGLGTKRFLGEGGEPGEVGVGTGVGGAGAGIG